MNVTMGLPRIIEILDGRKEIKTPMMEIYLKAPYCNGKDIKKIAKKVEGILKEMTKELKLPHEELEEGEELDEAAMQYDKDVKIKFSILRVSRKDLKEKRFLEFLLNCEKDLPGKKTPIIMPVFGRGRALFAYLEAGITKENILDAGKYLTGPCSCEVKAQNPGFDLLMSVKWDDLVNDTINIDVALPPLTGLTTSVEKEKPAIPIEEINLKSAAKMEEKPEDQQLPISIFLTLSGMVILGYILFKFLGRK